MSLEVFGQQTTPTAEELQSCNYYSVIIKAAFPAQPE